MWECGSVRACWRGRRCSCNKNEFLYFTARGKGGRWSFLKTLPYLSSECQTFVEESGRLCSRVTVRVGCGHAREFVLGPVPLLGSGSR